MALLKSTFLPLAVLWSTVILQQLRIYCIMAQAVASITKTVTEERQERSSRNRTRWWDIEELSGRTRMLKGAQREREVGVFVTGTISVKLLTMEIEPLRFGRVREKKMSGHRKAGKEDWALYCLHSLMAQLLCMQKSAQFVSLLKVSRKAVEVLCHYLKCSLMWSHYAL